MHHRPTENTGRPTEEELAMRTRIAQTGATLSRFEEKKTEVERRFATLYRTKKDLSADKWSHATAVETEQRIVSEYEGERRELLGANTKLTELGKKIAEGDFDSCEGVPMLHARSKALTVSLEKKTGVLAENRAKIGLLAASALQYDQVVILIDQMHEFFTQLNAALNGVLDELQLPPAEAEEQELDK